MGGFDSPTRLIDLKGREEEQGHCNEELPCFEGDIVGKVVWGFGIYIDPDNNYTHYSNQEELEQGILEVAEKILEFTW